MSVEQERRFVLDIDASQLLQEALAEQLSYEETNEQDSDESIPLKTYPVVSRIPGPKLTPLKDLAKPHLPQLPTKTSTSSYTPDYTLSPKQRKNVKSKMRARSLRYDQRQKKQLEAKSSLKALVLGHASRITKVRVTFKHAFEHPKGVWTGKRTATDTKMLTLEQVLAIPGMQLVKWNGRTSTIYEDCQGVPLLLMGAAPNSIEWDALVRRVDTVFMQLGKRLNWQKILRRRGWHLSVPIGESFGGGQTRPANFSHTPHDEEAINDVTCDPDVRRVAGLCDHYLKVYFPKIHTLYANALERIHEDNPSLRRNFDNSVFAAANINIEKAVAFPHVDYLNLLFGLCAVFPTGSFDYTRGGHLIIWELGLVIEFPPGTVILLPSALFKHSNTAIADSETRSSITFYSASGLFRWVHNGCMSDKEFKLRANQKTRRRWEEHRRDLWKIGVELLKPVDE
ncbi:hypothetical protein VKT23_019398 [Stygiomarasmius scandens]|uniref:Uncharacterized protein n=1 Tax=Marasmiellus scandens TaxID=2682957 RepID=A0ABR1ILL6_9AGAR